MDGYEVRPTCLHPWRDPPCPPTTPPSPDREQLRQHWLAAANDALERLFAEVEQDHLVTFLQRETRAGLLGNELAAWLLEHHVSSDPHACPTDEAPPGCPECGRPARRRTPPSSRLPRRQLQTPAGTIAWRREQWWCATCRVAFFPLDQRLQLGTEGYSPRRLRKIVRQGGTAPSFRAAAEDRHELAEVTISPAHVRRLCERLGREWGQHRHQEAAAYQQDQLPRGYQAPPQVATVLLDGGRYQVRAADQGPGVVDAAWKETKVACCQTLVSAESGTDPQPEPPRKFLEPTAVARLVSTMKTRQSAGRSGKSAQPRRRRLKKKRKGPKVWVKTVVATTGDSAAFGWQVAAEVHRRNLDRAQRKACVCDGSQTLWALFRWHLLPSGFIAILDFVHLLTYLYAAAGAVQGKGTPAAWALYERWLRLAWSGAAAPLLASLRAAARLAGEPPPEAGEDDPRRLLADAVTYVTNNRERMDYPRYRRRGLPIFSAPVESTIKQVNRRIKGSEKFWLQSGAEAVLQVRAA